MTSLTKPPGAGLARGTAGVLALVLAALLALRAGVVLAGEGLRPGVVGVVVTGPAPAPHPGLHPRHQQVQGGAVLDGPGLVERSPPDAVIDRPCGRVGGRTVQVDNVAAPAPPWQGVEWSNSGQRLPFHIHFHRKRNYYEFLTSSGPVYFPGWHEACFCSEAMLCRRNLQ